MSVTSTQYEPAVYKYRSIYRFYRFRYFLVENTSDRQSLQDALTAEAPRFGGGLRGPPHFRY